MNFPALDISHSIGRRIIFPVPDTNKYVLNSFESLCIFFFIKICNNCFSMAIRHNKIDWYLRLIIRNVVATNVNSVTLQHIFEYFPQHIFGFCAKLYIFVLSLPKGLKFEYRKVWPEFLHEGQVCNKRCTFWTFCTIYMFWKIESHYRIGTIPIRCY